MAASETLKIRGHEFTARALTMAELRQVLQDEEKEGRNLSIIDLLFEDGLPAKAFYLSLRLEEDDLDELYPEDIRELMEAVARANPTYAAMEKRLAAEIKHLHASLKDSAAG